MQQHHPHPPERMLPDEMKLTDCDDAVQVEEELVRIRVAAETMCPLRVVLASIVATGTGVVMATWQVR